MRESFYEVTVIGYAEPDTDTGPFLWPKETRLNPLHVVSRSVFSRPY